MKMAEYSPNAQRSILKRYNCTLAERIEVDSVLPYLRDVIDSYQADRIYAEKTSFKQNEKLLSTVSRAGPKGLAQLMKALDICYPNISSQMRQEIRQNADVARSSHMPSRSNYSKGLNQQKYSEQSSISSKTYKYSLRQDLQIRQLVKEILSKNRMKLNKLDADRIILLCESLNNKYIVDKIHAKKANFQQMEELLDILLKLGPGAFEEFINAISTEDPGLGLAIVEQLKKHNMIDIHG